MTLNINRRLFLVGSAAASALAVGMSVPAFGQEARLRYYFWGGPGRSDRKVDTATKFAAARGGLVVDSEWSPWGDYWPRLATQISGGNAPDLIQMDYRYIFEYARRGVLRPLDDLYPSIITATDFGDQRIDAGRVDGKLYGITIGDNVMGLGYDVNAWKAAGVTLTNDMTWTAFHDMCGEFKKANTKEGYYATNNSGGGETAFELWLRQKGKALYNAEGLAFDATDAAEWFEFWRKMSEDGLAPPADAIALQQPNPENNGITLQQTASSPMWSNEANPIGKLLPFPLEMVQLPRQTVEGPSGAYLKPSQFMSISATSKSPELAAEVINYLTNNLQSFKDVGVETAVPPSAKVREEIVPFLDEASLKSVKFVEEVSKTAQALPPPPPAGAGEITQVLTDTNLQVLFGNLTPEQAGAQLVQEAEAILARA
jgi:multiple sugar transport system substrate-binding protein